MIADALSRHVAASHGVVWDIPADFLWLRLGAAATFTSQLWFLSISPLSNLPFWSLCFEAYYLIFAGFCYFRGRPRVFIVLGLGLMAGPKILLLLPVWLVGVVAYLWRPSINRQTAAVLFVGSLALCGAFAYFRVQALLEIRLIEILGSRNVHYLDHARNFASDLLLALICMINLLAVRTLSAWIALGPATRNIWRWLASFTFSIYLYHLPLLNLSSAATQGLADHLLPRLILAVLSTLLCVFLLASVTEHKKHLLRTWLDNLETVLSERLQLLRSKPSAAGQ